MIVLIGVMSVIMVIAGVGCLFVSIGACIDDCFGWAAGFLVVGVAVTILGGFGIAYAEEETVGQECSAEGERLGAKAKVFNGDCRFFDESTKRWLSEDQWVYKNLGILED